MNFGFTNDKKEYDRVVRFREDAIADGWECKPTYSSESIERACTMVKGKFKMMILSRINKPVRKWTYEAHIAIWGPDTLSITPPKEYDMEELVKGLRICGGCGAEDVDTQRVAFCSRVCEKCLPEAREKLEFPGWCN